MQSQVTREAELRAQVREEVLAELAQERNKKAATRKRERVASGVDTVPSTSGAAAGTGNQSELDRVLAGIFGS